MSPGYGRDVTDARPASSRDKPLGVAELVRLAGRALDGLGLLWLEGEVTQVSKGSGSGHLYFSLAGGGTVLAAVMWYREAARLKFAIAPGAKLRVRGRIGVYDRDGKMQLYVDFAEPAGLGADAAAFEALKAKLAAEGMFAAAKKRPLPKFPRRIGVVTSRNGAAVHDIIRTVMRRLPTPILIADAAVQGPLAPAQLVNGMAMVVRAGVDVLIIGRGGGAATDLTAFNHERVVRTISRCPVPVISAIGHETDLSLADLAADVRVSTPTAAAEHAVPDGNALRDVLVKERRRLDREIRHVLERATQDLDRATLALHARAERRIANARTQLHELERRVASAHPRARIFGRSAILGELEKRLAALHPERRIAKSRRELESLEARRDVAVRRAIERRGSELGALAAQLHALSPLAVLERGFAMVEHNGALVRDARSVHAGDHLRVRLARGALDVVVETVEGESE